MCLLKHNNNLQDFIQHWDETLRNIRDGLSEGTVRDMLYNNLKGCAELSEDWACYRRLPADHQDRNYKFLRTAVSRTLTCELEDANAAKVQNDLRGGFRNTQVGQKTAAPATHDGGGGKGAKGGKGSKGAKGQKGGKHSGGGGGGQAGGIHRCEGLKWNHVH